ncbi:MAG TPA: spermidine/putrescine ABC transporter substrate-binding protein [Clostridiales bacterium]|nr:spermidine/putrescine ABC transporter substrate-binding protein [Clostridiales bacterium]
MNKIDEKTAILTLLIISISTLIFVGCGEDTNRVTINVYNWGDYIDEDVIRDFEDKYDIRVNYDQFATNEEMYVKIKSGTSKYDVLFPSDYMIERMIEEDLLQKINMDNIPNYKYIEPQFKNLDFDPNNEYSVPYFWGTMGILYNKTMVDEEVDSWKILWDEKYEDEIFMLDSQRDSIGITLKMLGYSLNTVNESELEEAKKALIAQRPLVLAYVIDEVTDKMVAGEGALAVVWSGDAVAAMKQNPDLDYVIPKEGSNLWFDSMVIPKNSEHKKEAELFINYMCETDIAYRNTDYVGYSTPHMEARKMLDPKIRDSEVAYPNIESLDNCEIFHHLGEDLKLYDRIWTDITAR